jgi:hypothetical protein
LTDGIYFDDLVAHATIGTWLLRKPDWHRPDGFCSYFNPRRHPDSIVEQVRAGLATAKAERVMAGMEVARVRITEAGRRVLVGNGRA